MDNGYGSRPPETCVQEYNPTAPVMANRKTREVKIHKLLSGWICQVGCQTIAFETIPTMLKELGRYLTNPDKVEKEYLEKA